MSEIDRAATFPHGVSLNNRMGLFPFSGDPSVLGFDAPVGSLALAENGATWRKIGALATDWVQDNAVGGVNAYAMYMASANRNVNTGDYLDGPNNIGTNELPFTAPFNMSLIAITLSTTVVETWRGHLQDDGVDITGAYLDAVNTTSVFQAGYNILIPEGARMMFQVQNAAGGISKPRMIIYVRRV